MRRLFSPPPCGEGSGVGGGRSGASVDAFSSPPDPLPPPSPAQLALGRAQARPGWGEGAARASGEERDSPPLNSTRLGKNPAKVLPPPVGAIRSTERPACALANSSNWCARGVQPRLAHQRVNGSGRR